MPSFDEFSKWLELIAGIELTPLQVWEVAERAYNLERLFNIREGLTRDDDWLVDRYFDEKTTRGLDVAAGRCISRPNFMMMFDTYYTHQGWDKKGNPKT
jgi:aldehyde:ferredoxin oxidoreductase